MRDAAPDHRPGDDPAGQRAPEPGRPGGGPPAAEERDPAGVRLRPEPGQQRGQHGQRADDRDAHHGDRAKREAAERAAADEEQAGHGGHHGQAGHQDRAARRAPCDPERLGERPALRPLLTLAPQVEQRVVDADRHPDDHHDLERVAVDRQPVADRRHHPDSGGQRGEREQHRDAGRDQRAEHGEHQDQRDRHRGHLGLAEVQRAVDRLLDACVTGLGDAQVRVPGLHAGDRVLEGGHRLVDVRDVAGDLERDQGTAGVLRHARRLDVRRICRVGGQRGGHLGRRLAHGRIGGEGGAGRRGLDQHVLGRRVELRRRVLVQHPLGLPGLAGAVFRQVPRAERLAGHENGGDEEQPTEDGGLAVRGAPAGHPFGQVRSFATPAWRRRRASTARAEIGNTELCSWRIGVPLCWRRWVLVGRLRPGPRP